jgi:hypothetical protein
MWYNGFTAVVPLFIYEVAMTNMYALTYTHSISKDRERLKVFTVVKISPNQREGNTVWDFFPPTFEGHTLYNVMSGSMGYTLILDGTALREPTMEERANATSVQSL